MNYVKNHNSLPHYNTEDIPNGQMFVFLKQTALIVSNGHITVQIYTTMKAFEIKLSTPALLWSNLD